MPKLLRIFLPLVLAALTVTALASAAPPAMTNNIGGWAKPHMAGDADGLNSFGFIPAPRTPNMVWVNDITGGPNWIGTIFGGSNGDASDWAFTKIDGVHYAIDAEYNNFRLIDLTNQSTSCYDANTVETTCGPVVSNVPCAGSQGDVAVYGTLVVRAHEGTHSVPWGDLTKACLVAGNEVQRVDLTSFDTDGDSFVLTQNGQNTIPIVRGANNTTAGISAALQGGNEQQQVILTGNDNNGDSFTLTHGANTSAPLVRGTNYTNNAAGQTNVQRALQGTSEVQTVTLSNYTVDGREYRLTYNGNQSTPIVRGQNNTAAGIGNALQGGNEVQVVTLTGFNPAVNNFQLRFTGSANISSVIGTGGVTYDTANVQNAINAITGFAGGATVSALTNAGFTVTFAGASANVNAAALQVVECNNGLDPCVYANRESARGGTAMTGWPTGGTVAVGTVTDTGYTLTFSGAHQGTNVSALTVTSGTGGVTGVVAETTPGTAGILPAGTQAALGTPADTGFTVTFSGTAANTDVAPLTVTNPVDTGGAAVISGSVRETVRGTLGRPGWTVGGTATVAALTDTGFTVTFAGTLAAIDVGPLTVTNTTGDVAGTVQERIKGAPGVTFRGISLIDISDPHHPVQIGAVPMCGNTHTITKYFDPISNKLFIFGTSGGSTTQPQWGLTSCPAFTSPYGSGFEEVVEIPVDHPENAHVLKDKRLPVGGNGNCHDVNVFEELRFMVTACSGTGGMQIIDLTNVATGGGVPLLPGIGYSWPGLQTVHQATISWSGRVLTVSGEPGGGSGAECSFQDDTVKPLIHIIDRATGKLLGQWSLPRPQIEDSRENCTTHEINIIPFLDRNVMAWSGYTAGGSVIDYTNPRAPREVASYDQLTLAGASGLGCWNSYWYNDYLYCNELGWGSHTFTVNEPWWKQAMTMDELNPQTNTKLIRCQVSFTGGPKVAKKNGTVNVNVKVFGPAPLQAAWGATVEIRAPGYYKALKTGEAGTVSAVVKATGKGKLSVNAPALENMVGCAAPSKTIARAVVKRSAR